MNNGHVIVRSLTPPQKKGDNHNLFPNKRIEKIRKSDSLKYGNQYWIWIIATLAILLE